METKIVYLIDNNGYYIGEYICQISPVTGDYVYPDMTYVEIAPQLDPDTIPHWNGASWDSIPNYRGKVIYNTQDCTQNKICDTIELPDGYTSIPPILGKPCIWNQELQQWVVDDAQYLAQLKKLKLQEVSTGFQYALSNGHFFSQTLQIEIDCRRNAVQNDLQNVQNIIKYLVSMQAPGLSEYRGYTNPETLETAYAQNVSLEQLQQIEIEMIGYGLILYNTKWAFENAINNAQSIEELNAINIDFGM